MYLEQMMLVASYLNTIHQLIRNKITNGRGVSSHKFVYLRDTASSAQNMNMAFAIALICVSGRAHPASV
jgi:DNA repair protein RadC